MMPLQHPDAHMPEGDRDRVLAANRQLHRSVAGVYDRVHPHMRNTYEQWLQARDVRRMMAASTSHRRPRVLDLGCGTGNLTIRFLEEGAEVTAVDMSAEMLAILSTKLSRAGVRDRCEMLESDVDSFVASHQRDVFDIVSMSSVAHHLHDYIRTLVRLGERLRPGGFLYLIHEPAHKDEMAASALPLRRLWSLIPRGGDRLLRKGTMNEALNREWQMQDTRYADYHYHLDGISVAAIGRHLAPLQYRLVDTSRYNAHETSLVSWFDNHWFSRFRYEQFQRTYFRALWRRDGDAD